MKKLFLTLILFFSLMVGTALANPDADVTFAWDANSNSDGDLAGYRIYQRAPFRAYTFGEGNEVGATLVGTETVTIRVEDGRWYWVATAYDTSGNESGPSNEVTAVIAPPPDTTPPAAPTGLRPPVVIIININ